MANSFQYLAQSLAPNVVGAFEQGRTQARQANRERFADEQLRAQVDRGNQFRQLAGQAYGAAPDQRQQIFSQAAAIDPGGAMQLEDQFAASEQRKQALRDNTAKVLMSVPAQVRPDVYRQMVPTFRQAGLDAPDEYTPEMDAMMQAYAGGPPKPEAYTLSAGQTRFVGDQPVASLPPSPGSDDGAFTLSPGQTRYGPDGKPIATSAKQPEPNEGFDTAAKLRGEYNTQSKEFRGVADAYQRIVDSASDPSAAGDLSLIFNYMKVLDPGSTVREGEFATAQNAGSIPARIIATYNKVMSGERLAPEQRSDFVGRATKLYQGQEQRFRKSVYERYLDLSRRYGVDPNEVIVDVNAAVPGASSAPPGASPRPSSPGPAPAAPPRAPMPAAGEITATGPNGQRIVLRNGAWVPLQ